MRISTNLLFQTGLDHLNRQQAQMLHSFKQAASGQRITAPSDDPLAASQTINLSQSLAQQNRFAENRGVLKQNLRIEENILDSVTSQLQEVKSRLIEVGNGALSDADRHTLADVLQHARDNLFELANSTDGNGHYLFSGHASSKPAFIRDGNGQVHYAGDDGQRLIQADSVRQIAAADSGRQVFMQAYSGNKAYLSEAAAHNAGTAVVSAPLISDYQGAHIGHRFEITFSDDALNPHFTVNVFDETGQVDSAIINYKPNASNLHLPGGVQLNISGQPADGDAFTVSPAFSSQGGAEVNLFETLDTLISQLKQANDANPHQKSLLQNRLNSAFQKIDLNYNQVLTVRASVGARLAEIDAIDSNGQLQALGLRSELSRLEDTDYFEVFTQLQQQQTALEAAALAFKRIQAANLLNVRS